MTCEKTGTNLGDWEDWDDDYTFDVPARMKDGEWGSHLAEWV